MADDTASGSASTIVVDLTEQAAAPAPAADVVVIAPEGQVGETLPPGAVLQQDGSVVLTLRFPVVMRWQRAGSDQVREERRDTLHMFRLNGAGFRAVMAANAGSAVPTGIAKSCRMEQGVFNALYDRMDGVDAAAAAQVFSYFLSGSATPTSGPPASP